MSLDCVVGFISLTLKHFIQAYGIFKKKKKILIANILHAFRRSNTFRNKKKIVNLKVLKG